MCGFKPQTFQITSVLIYLFILQRSDLTWNYLLNTIKLEKHAGITGYVISSKDLDCWPCKALGAYFQTTQNETEDNYMDLMEDGMISHEKSVLTERSRCRVRFPRNVKKKNKVKNLSWLRLDGSTAPTTEFWWWGLSISIVF